MEDNHAKKQPNNKFKLKILLLVILTNLLTMYIFTGPFGYTNHHLSLPLYDSPTLSNELNSTGMELAASHSIILELQQHLNSTNLLVQALRIELTSRQYKHVEIPQKLSLFCGDLGFGLPDEVRLAMGSHKLPLGFSPRSGSNEVFAAVGAGCSMSYEVGGECPVDDVFAQKFMLKGCEPLPRRRCHPKSPANYVEPAPFPERLWGKQPDTSII